MSEERKFLHDVSNSIAICFGNVKVLSAKLKKDPSGITPEYIESRLDKAIASFEKINELLVSRRQTIIDEEDERAS